jgi:replicative DNA helicase
MKKQAPAKTEPMLPERSMPSSADAERAVLGAILLSNEAILQTGSLQPEDFYLDSHRIIFSRMKQMAQHNMAIDLITLMNVLSKKKEVDVVGGHAYLFSLTDGLPYRRSIESWVRIVKDKAILRGIINASNCAVDSAMSEADTAQEVLADLGNKLIELGKPAAIQEALPATVDRVLERIVQKKYSGESCSGLTTGVTKLDELTNGISPTEYIIIGARTGHGKSLFVRQIILENAVMGVPCALMNYEMSKENSVECWLSAFSGIEFDHIRKPKFVSDEQLELLGTRAQEFKVLPITIDDCPGVELDELCARIRGHILRGAKLIVVDYLQLVRCRQFRNDRYAAVTEVSGRLRDISFQTGVPIIALSQLSRPEKGRENSEPTLFDLKECGNIENDSFQVWLLFRPKERDQVTGRLVFTGEDWVLVAKNRNGEPGNVPVVCRARYMRIGSREHTIVQPTPMDNPANVVPPVDYMQQAEMEMDSGN